MGGLENRIKITDEITNAKLNTGKAEKKSKENLRRKNTSLRNRLRKRSQAEFIIDFEKQTDAAELQRARFASKLQEIGNSRIEINHENEMKSGEDQLGEKGDGAHVERGSISNEEQLQEKEEQTRRPERRVYAGSLGGEMGSGGKCSFVRMTVPSLGNSQGVNQALLDEFMIQEDVSAYI